MTRISHTALGFGNHHTRRRFALLMERGRQKSVIGGLINVKRVLPFNNLIYLSIQVGIVAINILGEAKDEALTVDSIKMIPFDVRFSQKLVCSVYAKSYLLPFCVI